ncbi:MAG TPA: VanW family protein [Gaiellaceae bacterium]
MTEIAARLTRPIQRLGRPSTLFLVVAVLVAALGALLLVRAYSLRNSVLPGVSVAGVDVGGLSPAEARARIEAEIGARLDNPVTVQVGTRSFQLTPSNIYRVDAAASEQAAFDAARSSVAGRLGALAVPFVAGQDVEPVLRFHPSGKAALSDTLAPFTKRAVSARAAMDGTDAVVKPGRDGTAIDESAVLADLRSAALSGSGTVEVALHSVSPPISTAAAERAASTARTIAAGPVKVALAHEGQVGELGRRELASLIRFQPNAGAVRVVLDPAGVERKVGPLVRSFTEKPVDATFNISGDRAYVVKAENGTTLDVHAAQRAVYDAAAEPGLRLAKVQLATLAPDLTTKEAKALGISEQVSTFTTDMGESSANRIWNVHLLGNYLDGTIIEAGQTFSYNQVVGPRTVERGFREGQEIFAGVLIPSIGGGVCQTATTIFNAAFEAGLPVTERHNHSWYISHYPMGRDATVSWGGPDLVFKNDLNHAILINVSYTDSTFTISFYGTKQGRRVSSTTSSPTNYTQPKMQYAVDPNAAPHSVTVVAGGGPGFDTNVHRKVYQHGKLIREDDFFTRYTPENPVTVYGPGGHPPGPYITLPTSG